MPAQRSGERQPSNRSSDDGRTDDAGQCNTSPTQFELTPMILPEAIERALQMIFAAEQRHLQSRCLLHELEKTLNLSIIYFGIAREEVLSLAHTLLIDRILDA